MSQAAGVVAGIDLGGTKTAVAIADRSGRLLAEFTRPTDSHAGPDGVLDRIASRVADAVGKVELPLQGVGLGLPGLVDIEKGVVQFLPNLPTQWRGVAAADRLQQRLGCPVRLLNDARAATLGELNFGHGRDRPGVTFAFYSIGTGIGGGVVVDGQLRLGPWGAAGELGHQTVVANGPRCGCGNVGCLEAVASGPALAAAGVRLMQSGMAPRLYRLTEGQLDRVDAGTMAEAAAQGDENVAEAIKRASQYVGIAVANTIVTLSPDLIVLGGGVASLGERLLAPVRDEVNRRVGMFPTDAIEIKTSALGSAAGVHGAVALALQAARMGNAD